MKVTAIRVNKKECDALTTKEGRVCGETDKKAGQITLLPQGVREEIDSGVWDRGLCVHRFSENLTVNGLPQLKEGETRAVLWPMPPVLQGSSGTGPLFAVTDYR